MEAAVLIFLFNVSSAQYGLPPGLLHSVCYVESRHNINAIHKNDGNGNSVGICQIKHKTAKWLGYKGTEKQLMDPATNIYYSAKYLSYQIKKHKDITRGLVAYNKGNAKGLTKSIYSDKVLQQWRQDVRGEKNSCQSSKKRSGKS